MDNNNFGQELAKQTLDQIPQAKSNAKRIVGLVKTSGRITGYQLSGNSIAEKTAHSILTVSIPRNADGLFPYSSKHKSRSFL